jgi:nucleotide-binding universal stress UspA family protein
VGRRGAAGYYGSRDQGKAALEATRKLVRDDDAVVAIHIMEPGDIPWGLPESGISDAIEHDMDTRESDMLDVATTVGLQVTVVVDVPSPGERAADRIAREATERGADLVIVVSKHASGVRGLLLGSVAQDLLQQAPCPVVVVRPGREFE